MHYIATPYISPLKTKAPLYNGALENQENRGIRVPTLSFCAYPP